MPEMLTPLIKSLSLFLALEDFQIRPCHVARNFYLKSAAIRGNPSVGFVERPRTHCARRSFSVRSKRLAKSLPYVVPQTEKK